MSYDRCSLSHRKAREQVVLFVGRPVGGLRSRVTSAWRHTQTDMIRRPFKLES